MTAGTTLIGRDTSDLGAAGQAVAYVRGLIEQGDLRPGDRLPPERELVRRTGVSRTSVHVGLHTLAAMGVITIRQGAGAFITAGPPSLVSQPLALLSLMHDISPASLFEARQAIECSAAALAAERATGHQLVAISDEVIGMYSTLGEPRAFRRHVLGFHRAVAACAKNLAIGALIDMLASLHDELRPAATDNEGPDLQRMADLHRAIYHGIRRRDADGARAAMTAFFRHAQAHERAASANATERAARVS